MQSHGLKPPIVRGFKVSRDPQFVEKLEDIVGLYMSPPEHALVRRGVFTSVPELEAAIEDCVAHHNVDSKPFIWTNSARDILQMVIRSP